MDDNTKQLITNYFSVLLLKESSKNRWSNIKKDAAHPTSKMDDEHIQHLITHLKDKLKVTQQEIDDAIKKTTDKFAPFIELAPVSYGGIAENLIFTALSDLYVNHKGTGLVLEGCPVFNVNTFRKLTNYIQVSYKGLFPLNNPDNAKNLRNPKMVLVGYYGAVKSDHKQIRKFLKAKNGGVDEDMKVGGVTFDVANKQHPNCPTAYATPMGEFVFNVTFMQHLMNLAFIQQEKPVSKYFKCNGGDIPDCYGPVEFLILHEFYHYKFGDFNTQETIKDLDHKALNWATDFRSNHDLRKMRHTETYNGLYSKNGHLDKFPDIISLYKVVKEELDKIRQYNKEKNPPPENGEPGDPSEGDGDIPEPSGTDSHEPWKGPKPKSTKPGKGGTEEGDGDNPVISRTNDSGDTSGGPGEGHNPNGLRGGAPGTGISAARKIDYIHPTFSWQEILDQLLKTGVSEHNTYKKMHRTATSVMTTLDQDGAARIKPAVKVIPADIVKLAVVIDVSGSMFANVPKCFSEVLSICENYDIDPHFVLGRMADGYDLYECRITSVSGSNITGQITQIGTDINIAKETNIQALFDTPFSGGTTLTPGLVAQLKKLMAEGFSVLFFTDTDLISFGNLEPFKDLLKTDSSNIYVIFSNKHEYDAAQKVLSIGSKYTYMNK